jgi:hypothetical protein
MNIDTSSMFAIGLSALSGTELRTACAIERGRRKQRRLKVGIEERRGETPEGMVPAHMVSVHGWVLWWLLLLVNGLCLFVACPSKFVLNVNLSY